MSPEINRKRNGYDVFLSHNRADKDWVRELAKRLSSVDYNGRPLRPWLDEQTLDPGIPSGDSELTSAIDRSRFFAIVLSPSAVASQWVTLELDYFLGCRSRNELILILRETCATPPPLSFEDSIDFRSEDDYEERLQELVAILCADGGPRLAVARRRVGEAITRAVASDPGGFSAEPTREREALLGDLIKYDIDDAGGEGLAICSFVEAASHLLRLADCGADATYNMKMLLGECLAVALLRSPRYRQAAQRFIDLDDPARSDPVLWFSLTRAYSKLAEIDPALIDASVLLRLASRLDLDPNLSAPKRAIALLLGRVTGKIRGTDLGDLLIKTLSEGGSASNLAAAAAISYGGERASPVFYLYELELASRTRGGTEPAAMDPPSRKLLALLRDLELNRHSYVCNQANVAKADIRRDYGIDDFPYGYSWFNLRVAGKPAHPHNAPFIGKVLKSTTRTMVEIAEGTTVSDVVCLTEPRIVDALFDNCGAFLIMEQEPDSHQCRRLRSRGTPFSMLDRETMSALADGDYVVVEQDRLRVLVGKS